MIYALPTSMDQPYGLCSTYLLRKDALATVKASRVLIVQRSPFDPDMPKRRGFFPSENLQYFGTSCEDMLLITWIF